MDQAAKGATSDPSARAQTNALLKEHNQVLASLMLAQNPNSGLDGAPPSPVLCAYRRAVADGLCRDVACSAERAAPGECRGAGELYLGLMSSLFFRR